jgi:lantibiotic modifying enzyme
MTPGHASFLEAAAAIGADLCRDALWDGRRCNWLGDAMEPVLGSWQVVLRSFSIDIYGGTSGVGLFLARLYRLTSERLFRTTSEGVVEHCFSMWDSLPIQGRLSYYAGSVGIADALVHIGEALDQPELIDKALSKLSSHLDTQPGPYSIDLINGIAGAIPPLLRLGSRYARPEFLERAIQLGVQLLATAKKRDEGWSWTTIDPAGAPGQRDLVGFSHGTAGVAWALTELYKQTGRADYLEAALEGIRYEQSWFQRDLENWPDFRGQPTTYPDGTSRYNCALAWCHGAPGIALSRLRAFQITGDSQIREQANAALRSTLRSITASLPGQESYCLCHGIGGNAEALIYAAEVFGDSSYLDRARQAGLRGIELYLRADKDWPCGVPGGGLNPSLLIGLAGIGYFYLRLYDPARFPSVLIVN